MIDPLLNQSIRHAVDMAGYGNWVLAKMIRVLNLSDADLLAALQKALAEEDADSFKVQRLDGLLKAVQEINTLAYAQMYGAMQDELKDYTDYEAGFQYDLYKSVVPVSFEVATVIPEQVYAAAMAQPFEGRLLKDWAAGLRDTRLRRIKDTITIGFTQSKTTADIVKEIRGTKALKYADGLLDTSRNQVESIVKTALSHTAQVTRSRFYERNKDIIAELMWVSTLDSRTSSLCRIRDHLLYTQEHEPVGHNVPWLAGPGRLHFCCRSTSIGLLKGQKTLFGTRASVNGPVDANLSYSDWLKEQSAEVQDEILGKRRGAQYRAEGMQIDRFVDNRGRQLSLKELKARDARAFNQPQGSFTIYDPGYPRVQTDTSTPAKAAAAKLAEQTRLDELETGAFFTPDGAMHYRRQGEPNQVKYDVKELRSMKGALFTHNHPAGSSFSTDDVKLASFAKLSEVQAVSNHYRHIITPVNGWPWEGAIEPVFEQELLKAKKEVATMVGQGELDARYGSIEELHLAWVRAAKILGLNYVREAS